MKRIIAILLALFLPLTALASTDVSAMTTEELLELYRSVRLELQARDADTRISLAEGEYIVGEDIPAGTFFFIQISNYWSGTTIRHYSDAEKSNLLNEYHMDNSANATCMMTLKENELLTISGNNLMMCATDPNADRDIPGATLIPVGNYIVGQHLPAGSYSCHYYQKGSTIRIYQDEEQFDKGSSYFREFHQVSFTAPTANITLKDGMVIAIVSGPLLMKQESGQLFFK